MSNGRQGPAAARPSDPVFPVGGGELGALIRNFDWSATELGPIDAWSPALKTATNIVLQSPLPLVMLWGRNGIMIYNDAYSAFAGQRHPRLLGSRVLEGWAEVADFNAHVLAVGLAGGTLSFKSQELTLYRNNVPEQVWMDLNYGPVLGDDDQPAGVLAIVVETTGQVKAEQALAAQRAAVEQANQRLTAESAFLQQLFENAPSFMTMLSGPEHRFALLNAGYRRLIGGRDVLGLPLAQALPEVVDQGFIGVLDQVLRTGEPYVGAGARVLLQRQADGPMEERVLDFVYQPVSNADGVITGVFVEGQDVTERAAAEEHLRLIINELNHRVKNTLAMMQAIAAQTFRNADDIPQAQEKFTARIMALAKANDLLTGQRWVSASLQDVVRLTLETYFGEEPHRYEVGGPMTLLSPKTALSLSMALHELATNAMKYGAGSNKAGRIAVAWTVTPGGEEERLRLTWREAGGPAVTPPQRRGFGSRLIERGLAAELGGEVRLDFAPEGLVCIVDAPLRPHDED